MLTFFKKSIVLLQSKFPIERKTMRSKEQARNGEKWRCGSLLWAKLFFRLEFLVLFFSMKKEQCSD